MYALCQYHTVLVIVACFKITDYEISSFGFLSQDGFGYLGSIDCPYEFYDSFYIC
jgi:hypothetical protein